jgi:C-terminal peptidase prc
MKDMRTLRYSIRFVYICLVLLLPGLTGCTLRLPVALGSSETPTPALTHTSVPTVTPTLTPTVTPTYTPTPTSTATATPLPSPSPTPPDFLGLSTATTPDQTPTLVPRSERLQLFNEVWSTVDEHYLYPDFRGLDWDAIHAEFKPRVIAATTNEEFYAAITEMVGRLGDQHSRFLAPSAADEEDALSTGFEASVGIGVITVPTANGALIRQVFPNSPADQAGLRIRDRIVAVDGTATNNGGNIQGPEGTEVRLSVLRPGEAVREVVLTRQPVEGRVAPTARRLEGDIGYLAVTTLWVNDMDDQVSGALTDMVVERPLRGLILDLRSNPGGWREVLVGILSHFVRGEVGAFFDQRTETPLMIEAGSGPDLRDLPLVVLVDRGTSSYAELLAAILQAEADALVIGLPLVGNTETIYAYELAGGARLWVAQEGFHLRSGVNLEGQGVQPDVLVNVDWTRYSEETDPYILEALRYLNSHESAQIR